MIACKVLRRVAAILGCLFAAAVVALPAPWQVWRSLLDGREVCAQTSPGHGWTYARGPFKDLNCTVPGKPGG